MIRLVFPLLVVLGLVALATWLVRAARHEASARRGRRAARRPGLYDWDRRSTQVARRLKGVGGPAERPTDIVAWLDAHAGVEAYVEPKTVMSSLSVVLVDGAGEWRRFELREDRAIRELARERGLPVFDAARTGYPPRMRRSQG